MSFLKRKNLLLLLICSALLLPLLAILNQDQGVQAQTTPSPTTPTPTPTQPPPPPKLSYTEVAPSDEPLPIIVQRLPRRGEEHAPDGTIELTFDRAMNQKATHDAFSLQLAAESPQVVAGRISWPDERIMQFSPGQALDLASVYDVILTQDATDEAGLPLAESFSFRFNTPGYLEVTQVVPAEETRDVETDGTITVMFNRPVVPLTSLAESENFPQPLSFDPPIDGAGEWLNTSIYIFTPADDLPGGTTFTVDVDGNLQDVTEQTSMADSFSWQFSTQPPEVVWSSPSSGASLVDVDTAIQLTFNQPIDPQSAQAMFELSRYRLGGLLGGGTVDGQFEVDGRVLTFTPAERLEYESDFNVTISAGVTSVSGGIGSKADYSFDFATVPLPEIVATDPFDGEQDAYPGSSFKIEFNTRINPDTVMAHVEMTPPLPITPTDIYTYYAEWNNSFSIHFSSQPSTDYEVRISPGIEDPYGNQTSDDLTINYRTDSLRPQYNLLTPSFIGTYDSALPAKLILRYTNIDRVNLRLYQLEPQDVLRPEYEWRDYQPGKNKLLREWQVGFNTVLDKPSYEVIDLLEDGGALEPGVYLLDTDSPDINEDYYRNQQHLLVVTKLALTLKTGVKETMLWATDLATGKPQTGLKAIFYADNQRAGEAVTDQDGIARLDLSNQDYRTEIMALLLPDDNGDNFSAVADRWNRGISLYEFNLDLAYDLPPYNVHMYTERSIYRPDQTVYFKGVMRQEQDVAFELPPQKQVHVSIRSSTYEVIFDEMVEVSPNGSFNGEVKLEQGASLGRYTIQLDFEDRYFEEYFQVAAYRSPEFEVMVEPDDTELLRGDSTGATVNVNYFFGGSLQNTEVTWNVIANDYQFAPRQLSGYSFYDTDDPYTCFDCWWWQPEVYPNNVLEGQGTTDANGELRIKIDGQQLDNLLDIGSHELTIEATATGPDNQLISGRQSIVLHKGDYYIGLSPQKYVADAQQETAVDLIAVDWQAQRLADKEINVQIIRREWVNTFIENENGGGYWSNEVQETLVETLSVTSNEKGEAVAKFIPPQGGSYQIVAQDAATLTPRPDDDDGVGDISPIRSSIFIWVMGEDNVSWRRENHDRITLISDRVEYSPGETAEILIPSPFEGEHVALVTVERGTIIEHTVLLMQSSSETFSLPITDQHVPNIYVSVVLMKGRQSDSNEEDGPQLADYKVGILPLDVRPIAQKLTVNLTTTGEEPYQPGDEVTYQLDVTDADQNPVQAEFSLDLVDKAVLTLQPRQPEAIVEAFYHRRGLGINTANNLAISVNRMLEEVVADLELDQEEFFEITEAESLSGAGADEMARSSAPPAVMALGSVADDGVMDMAMEEPAKEEMAMKNSAPGAPPAGLDIRAEFSDTAFWEPLIMTDQQGQAEVTVTLPDNLTTWVMRGVGATANTQVGEATLDLLSTKPLLIRPVTPRFFVVDDRAEVAANISNNTPEPQTVEATLSGSGYLFGQQTEAVQTVTIPANSELNVMWEIFVEDVTEADLVFSAVSELYEDAARPRLTTGPDGTLLVYRYTAPDIVGTAGQLVEGGSRTEVIALPPNFDDRQGELTVQVDPSLAAGMRDGLDYLEHYEYECTEQTISRFLPNMLTYRALQELGLDDPELADKLPPLIEEGLNKLYVRQNDDGGWGWWPNDRSNPYISAYVVFALTKAKQSDITIQDYVLADGQQYLLNNVTTADMLTSYVEANRQAFILYTLAEDGQAPNQALDDLFERREKLSHYGKAYLAMALDLARGQQANDWIDTLLSDLSNAAILSATGAHWEEESRDWWAMNSDTRSTAIILNALTKLDPDNALNPNVVRWLMVARRDGIWDTTQETAWSLISLTDWMVETGELEGEYDYNVALNQADVTAGQVNKQNIDVSDRQSIPLSELLVETGNRLTVARSDGNGRLYYSAHLKVYLPVSELEPANRGVIVQRRYTLDNCQYEVSRTECTDVTEANIGDVIRVDLTIIAPNNMYYVVVEDPLPAGAEAIDTGLATTSLLAMDPTLDRPGGGFEDGIIPYYYPWWQWYSRSEIRDEKVVLFADYLRKGTYEYSYTMRATLAGDYQVIPTLATEFYFPEVFGRSAGRALRISE
ncbi:Ig-like domain-containing protein [Anaerolineales bacterium HSG6]|nr:Ig-like domain-containing protein [Anaerolineales bacterium HSG6]